MILRMDGAHREMAISVKVDPEVVLRGHHDRFIAHRRARGQVVRLIDEYDGALPVTITVYAPVADRYFKRRKL